MDIYKLQNFFVKQIFSDHMIFEYQGKNYRYSFITDNITEYDHPEELLFAPFNRRFANIYKVLEYKNEYKKLCTGKARTININRFTNDKFLRWKRLFNHRYIYPTVCRIKGHLVDELSSVFNDGHLTNICKRCSRIFSLERK